MEKNNINIDYIMNYNCNIVVNLETRYYKIGYTRKRL